MATLNCFILCLLSVALKVSIALQWTGPKNNDVTISACSGDNITLPWDFETSPGEHVINLEWYFVPAGETERVMIATEVAGNFLPVTSGSQHQLEYLPHAGITLLNVAVQNSGNYSVHVNLNLHGSVVMEMREVKVIVSDAPDCQAEGSRVAILEWQVQQLTSENNQLRNEKGNMSQLLESMTSKEENYKLQIDALASRVQQLEATCAATTRPPPTTTSSTTPTTTTTENPKFSTCQEIAHFNTSITSGVYTIYLDAITPLPVYCDMDTDGGGWMVIQRRQDGSVNFHMDINAYASGFGDLSGEFWLGLDPIFRLTNSRRHHLRVDLWDSWTTAHAEYDWFNVTDRQDGYRLHAVWLGGPAGDSFGRPTMTQQNWLFSAADLDRDGWPLGHCAGYSEMYGGWWYGHNCGMANLNGHYGLYQYQRGMIMWYSWKFDYPVFKKVEMKIRPHE